MRIAVTGEADPDAIEVSGGQPAAIIEVDTTIVLPGTSGVSSVNGVPPDGAGNVTVDAAAVGADPAGTATSAVSTHTAASDPHGDRAYADTSKLAKSSNLADLNNASTARTNLGLGGSATLNVGTATGTVAAGDDSRITGAAQKASNLSDLASASTARTNLGLGGAAVLNVGTATGTVAAGDDSRLTNSRTPTAHASTHATGGSDQLTPAAIGAMTTTDGDARYLTLSAYGNAWAPADQGLIAWSFDPATCSTTGTTLSAGYIYLVEVVLRQAATIAKINAVIGTAGATLTANQCLAGLYDTGGTRRGVTGDMSTTWTTAGNKAMPLTASYSAAAGKYYLALLFNGTTSPTFACGSTLGANFTPGNANLSAGGYRFCRSASGQTSLPTSITLSGYTPDANNVWVGAS